MPDVLLSGPAGAGKTAAAESIVAAAEVPTVLIDFQALYASLLGIRRDPETGRYPERLDIQDFALPIAEYVRLTMINRAVENEVDVVATNSDGAPQRRGFLLGLLGPGAVERVIDPGIEVVRERLAVDGVLSTQCEQAIGRWYARTDLLG